MVLCDLIKQKLLGECAKEFGQDYIDLTTRQQCELRYLTIDSLPIIIKRLATVGIDAYQTGVDNIRGIVADPFDDLAFDNVIPSHSTLLKIHENLILLSLEMTAVLFLLKRMECLDTTCILVVVLVLSLKMQISF